MDPLDASWDDDEQARGDRPVTGNTAISSGGAWHTVGTHYTCLREMMGCPGGSAVKDPPADAGTTGLLPGRRRSHTPRGG